MRNKTLLNIKLCKTNRTNGRCRIPNVVPRGSVKWRDKDQICKDTARRQKLAKIKQLQWSLSLRGKSFAVKMCEAFAGVGSRDLNYEQYRKQVEEIIGNLVLTPEPMSSATIVPVQNESDNSLTLDFRYYP